MFRRAYLNLPATPNPCSRPTTAQKLRRGERPRLGALVFQFGRYLLISSSRPGTQPANLQGIWNKDMNPMWDSKYTTNINPEMDYWPAEVGNLAECAEPLFRMVPKLTDQGSQVAGRTTAPAAGLRSEHGPLAVAAPMDGQGWGTFTAGGAGWRHTSGSTTVHGRQAPGQDIRPQGQRRSPGFPRPASRYGWLVTNPSTSPENFRPSPARRLLRRDHDLRDDDLDLRRFDHRHGHPQRALRVRRPGLRYPGRRPGLQGQGPGGQVQAGVHADRAEGIFQEWLEDRDETEEPPPYLGAVGPVPGPSDLRAADAEVRPGQQGRPGATRIPRERLGLGLEATCWARLGDGAKAMENFTYAMHQYTTTACSRSAPGRCRSTAPSACRPPWPRCCSNPTRTSWRSCRPCRPPGKTETSKASSPAAASRSACAGRTGGSRRRRCCRRTAGPAGCVRRSPEGDRPGPVRVRPPPGAGPIEFKIEPGAAYVLTAAGR